jgi:hypothetical protein
VYRYNMAFPQKTMKARALREGLTIDTFSLQRSDISFTTISYHPNTVFSQDVSAAFMLLRCCSVEIAEWSRDSISQASKSLFIFTV